MNVKSGSLYIYVTSFLIVLCAFPARFAFGVVVAIELNFIMLLGSFAVKLFLELALDEFCDFLVGVTVIFGVVFFKLLLCLCCPLISMTLGFVLFLPALSTLVIGSFSFQKDDFSPALKSNFYNTQVFCIVCLIFFLVRDILGYGTITLPGFGDTGLFVIRLFYPSKSLVQAGFWATIPGGLVFCAVFLAALNFVRSKVHILRRTEQKVFAGPQKDLL